MRIVMKKNETFKWDDKKFVEFYTDSANVIILERLRLIQILLEIVEFHFPSLTGLNILDLGCGDGIITRHIYDTSPDNSFFLVDASEEMLQKAKINLSGANATYSHCTFQDCIASKTEYNKYNLVFSANAVHHLDFVEKTKLFSKLYNELQFGGLFLNIDPVHPNSAYSEEIQFAIWRNWMNERLANSGHEDNVGKYDTIPSVYKNNLENKPSSLRDQLEILEKCGFRDVDCFYKYSIFSLFGGTK